MKIMKKLILASSVVMLCIPMSATAQMTKEQFQFKEKELSLMTLAIKTDDKCALLNTASRAVAKSIVAQNELIFIKMGQNDQVETLKNKIGVQIEALSCEQLVATPQVKESRKYANNQAGMYLMAWDIYYKNNGDSPNGQKNCGGGSSHDLIRDAVKANAFLIENLKSHPQANAYKKNSIGGSNYLKQVCNHSNGLFELKYNNVPLGTVITAGVNSYLYGEKAGPGIGLLKVSPNFKSIWAYRGTIPKGQQEASVPWAILRESSEHTKEADEGLLGAFRHNSHVHVGFLRDKRFAVSAHPPSAAKFTSAIYKEIIVKATNSNKEWRLSKPTTEFKISYNPANYDKAQFVLSAAKSKEIMDAVSAGNNLKITVVRNQNGKLRTIDVETISGKNLKEAIAYAYAPKITIK